MRRNSVWLDWVRSFFSNRNQVSTRRIRRSHAVRRNIHSATVEGLEDRVLLAATSFNAGTLTIDFSAAGEFVGVSNDGTNISIVSSGTVTGAGNTFATNTVTRVVVTDSGNLAGQSLTVAGTADYSLSSGLDVTGVESVNLGRTISTGAADLSVTAGQSIALTGSLSSTDGDILLSANQQTDVATGDSDGIVIAGVSVTATGTGTVTLLGRGGQGSSSSSVNGVDLLSGATISGFSTTVTGTSGDGTGSSNRGVSVGSGAIITSGGGNVEVTGTNVGGDFFNSGVAVEGGAKITATGTGTVTVTGTASSTTTGSNNSGIDLFNTGSSITSTNGNVVVIGTGGGGDGSYGVAVRDGATLSAGGSGTVTVRGTATSATSGSYGVAVNLGNASITSSGGKVSVTGISNGNAAVYVNAASISSGSNAAIDVIADSVTIVSGGTINSGTGQTSILTRTAGTLVNLGGSDVLTGSPPLTLGLTDAELDQITAGTLVIGDATAGAITISGAINHGNNLTLNTGAGLSGVTNGIAMASNKSLVVNALGYINLLAGGNLTTTGSGSISVTTTYGINIQGSTISTVDGNIQLLGNQQATPSTGFVRGVYVAGAAHVVASGNGAVTIAGRGGDDASNAQFGVWFNGSSTTVSGKSVNITGTGGTAGDSATGVYVNAGATVTSTGGGLTITGYGGATTGTGSVGVELLNQVRDTGSGDVTIVGVGGNISGDGSQGVRIFSGSSIAIVASAGGKVSVTGTAQGTGQDVAGIELSRGGISAGGNGTITVSGQGVTGPGVQLRNAATISSTNGIVDIAVGGSQTGAGLVLESGTSVSSGGNADLRITANAVDLRGTLSSGTGLTSIKTSTASTPIDLGGADVLSASPTLGLSAAELNRITAGTLLIGNSSTGNITFSAAVAPTSVPQLELVTGGQILDSNSTGNDISVTRLGLTAAAGIGVGNPLETAVSNLEATTATGGIFINNTGALSIGGVNSTLKGLRVTGASGGIDLQNTSGEVRITTAGDIVIAPGNVSIKTLTSGNIITANNNGFFFSSFDGSVSSTGGTLTLDAAGDIDLGETAATNSNGDVKSLGNMVLTAAGNITLDDQASAQTLDAAATITITAGGSVSLLSTHSAGSLIGTLNASGGLVSISTGAGGTFTANGGTANPGIFSGAGGIRIAADNMTLLDDLKSQGGGSTTLVTVTAGRPIDLGTETSGALSLTATEINQIAQGNALTIGDSNSGAITLSASITPSLTNLNLVTGASVLSTTSSGSDITVTNLNITAPTGIGSTANPLRMDATQLATNSAGSNGDQYLREANSVTVRNGSSLSAGTGTINLTSGEFRLSGSMNATAVANAGTLAGSGVINGNVTSTSMISPGVSGIGTITINGNFTPQGQLNVDLIGTAATAGVNYDQIIVNGAVDLSGLSLSYTSSSLTTVSPFTTVTLVQNDGQDATTPSGTADGTLTTLNGTPFLLYNNGGTGNDLVLVQSATPTTVYVDDSFAANAGQVIDDADLGATGDQSAVYGINAFNTIAAALAAVSISGTVVVNAGTYAEAASLAGTQTLRIGGADQAQAVTINSLATVTATTVNLAGTSSLTIGDATDRALSGLITGTGSLTKQGTGSVTVSGNNTYSGTTTVSGGTLRITANNGLGTSAAGTTVVSGGQLDLRNVDYTTTEAVTLQGGTLNNSLGTTTFAGGVTLMANSSIVATGTLLNLTGAILGNFSINTGGTGILRLSNIGNSFSSIIVNNGTLQLGASGVIPDLAEIFNGSTFDLNGFDETVNFINGGGTVRNSQSTFATLTLGAGNSGSGNSINGAITGAINLVKIGSGIQYLGSANNTYTGTTTINGGTLSIASSGTQALGAVGGETIINANGTLFLNGVAYAAEEPITINGGKLFFWNTNSFSGPITLSSATATVYSNLIGSQLTLNGVIDGDQGLNKTNLGTLILAADNTYTGSTTVNGGTVLINGSLAAASAVQVNDGGTLGGSGTIHGTVNVASGGKLSPGNSPGVLNSGSVTFASGSTYLVQVNGATAGTFDQLNVTGSVSLGGSTLDLSGTITSHLGQQIVIIKNDDNDAVVGTFDGIDEGDVLILNGVTFRITYQGGTNSNDVVLTEVDPPTDVAVTMTQDTSAAVPGGTIVYTITVTNTGAFDATVTSLIDNFAAQIETATWTSQATGGATGNTLNGSGNIAETLTLPVGASVVYTVTGTIFATAGATLSNTVTISQAGDARRDDNEVTLDVLLDNPVAIEWINDAAEPSTHGKFRVTQLAVTPHDTIITYSIGGTAKNGEDYTTLTGSVVIPSGSTSADIDVLVLNDTIVEPDETVTLTLTGFTQADPGIRLDQTLANLTATANLTDNDTNVLEISAPTITETNADQTVTFTVKSPNGVEGGFDVAITTTNGTAGSADYELVTTTVHFDGTAGETRSVSVTIKGDTLVEANETFSVALGTVSGTTAQQIAAITSGASATATITNDDTAIYTISNATITEGGDLVFTVSLSNPVDVETTVNVTFTDGTTSADDFDHTTRTVTFLTGDTTSQVILIATTVDSVIEADESLTASLALTTPLTDGRFSTTTDTGTGTITNNDANILQISAPTITETNADQVVTFIVTSPNAVQGGFDVAITTTNGTAGSADYELVTTTVHFDGTAGETRSVSVTVKGDTVVEANETFHVTLGAVSGTTATQIAAITTGASATATIVNDDSNILQISAPTITETNTDQVVTFTVTSPNAVQGGFDVAITTANGTAGSADYELVTTTVHFDGTAGETRSVSVTIKGDTVVEANETFHVTLGAVSGTTATQIAAITTGASATATIVNDDSNILQISAPTITETDTDQVVTFTVTSPNAVQGGFDVVITTANGTAGSADYELVTTTVHFDGTTGETRSVSVTIKGDTVVEADETFNVTLGAVSGTTATQIAAITTGASATATIINDDTATFTINNVTVNEADGSLVFDLTTDKPLDIDVTIDVTFTNGSATDADYANTTQSITFLAGQTAKQVTVAIDNDNIVEATESFTASLSTTTSTGGRALVLTDTGTGTITDNDTATFTINNVTVNEADGSLVFDLATDKPLDIDVTIDVTFTNGSASSGDYTNTTQQITFLAGQTAKQVTVAINDDNIVEATESFIVTLSTATPMGGRSIDLTDTGTGTITDNDSATFTIEDVAVSEGAGSLVFDLVTDKPLDIDVTITVTFTAGSATGAGSDFTSTTQQITFLAGETSKQVSIAINDDAIVEATETFTATINTSTAFGGRSVSVNDTATGTITDNDVATVSIVRFNDGAETNSPTNGKFRITQSAVSSTDTVVNYTVTGTATPGAGNDYTALTGTATIPAGQTTVDIDIVVLDDAVTESTETVIVTLTGFGAHDPDITLDIVEATVNITDNDTPAITSGATASVVENTPSTTVVLNVDVDPASVAPGHALIYSLSGPDAALFNIDSATGEIRFNTSPDFDLPADQDGNNVYQVTVTVTADTTPTQSTSQNLTITVTPVNDITPVFTNPTPTFEIAENSANGTVVGSVPATDGDLPAQTLTYSIVSGNLAGAFTINPATGEIKVASSSSLNFEQVAAFTLTVRVTDNTPTARTADAIVTINVTNVVENPTITIPNSEGTYHIGSYPAFVSPDATYLYDDVAAPNYEGSKLTVSIVSGRSRKDRLSIVDQGEKPGQINTRGRKVFLGSIQIGTFKGGRGRNADLVVTLNANATSAAVDRLVRRLNFQAKDQIGRDRTVQIQVTNISGVNSNLAVRNISVVE